MLACGNSQGESSTGDQQEGKFFDVPSYFEAQISQLRRAQQDTLDYEKHLEINQQTDVQQLDTLDLQQELKLFRESGINKISWQDKYSADSTYQDGRLQQVEYRAQDEKLRTRLLRVQFSDNGEPSRVHIENRTDNPLLQAQQYLTYLPGKGFEIKQAQQMRFMSERNVRVEVQFLR